ESDRRESPGRRRAQACGRSRADRAPRPSDAIATARSAARPSVRDRCPGRPRSTAERTTRTRPRSAYERGRRRRLARACVCQRTMRGRAGAVLTPAYHPDVAFSPRSSEFGTAERSTAVRTALAALFLIGQLTAAPHWPAGARVAVWIDLTRAPIGAAPLVERAMKNWSDASNGQLTLVRVNTRAEAAIRVLFVQSDTN